ncbi:MAG: GAF domain-containing protein [Anaerolineales bacterium]|nr:GAF domain-containing protein [Anaerolineales bacterium]
MRQINWYNSIRTRLIILLVLFALLPIGVLALVVTPVLSTDAETNIYNNLTAVAILKENEVLRWAADLQTTLQAEIQRSEGTRFLTNLLQSDLDSAVFRVVYDSQLANFQEALIARPDFVELFILNTEGVVILSTDAAKEGRLFATQRFFERGLRSQFVQPPVFDVSLMQYSVIFSQPILSDQGEVLGVLAGRATLGTLNTLMTEKASLGETGETYLVNADNVLLTDLRVSDDPNNPNITGSSAIRTEGVLNAIRYQQADTALYSNYQGIPVYSAYRWLPDLEIALVAEQEQVEAQRTLITTTRLLASIIIASTLVAVLAAFFVGASLIRPLSELTTTASQVASGNLALQQTSSRLNLRRGDEIGMLSQAFNAMTIRLRELIVSLEERVAQRTRQFETRNEQLLGAAEVSRSVATVLDTSQLIQRVVDLIQQRFDLYYVGLFLVDEYREWAVLRAGTGQAGETMLARGHRLKIEAAPGSSSMIGWCIANAQPRIALEAGEDPIRLATADLPDTRSEAAVPLRSRGQVLGAISIQSTRSGAFDRETIAIFQTMADQVAVALDNARLFSQAQETMEAMRQAYGEFSHQAWMERLRRRPLLLQRDPQGLKHIREFEGSASASGANPKGETEALVLPIKSRGRVIGTIKARPRTASGENQPAAALRPDELNLLETLVDQLGVTLDSARLFEETQMSAERERLVGEITGRMRATLDIDTILQTAVREIRQVLDLKEVEVRMGIPQTGVVHDLPEAGVEQPETGQIHANRQPIDLRPGQAEIEGSTL